jgi:ankyrin repeat protein
LRCRRGNFDIENGSFWYIDEDFPLFTLCALNLPDIVDDWWESGTFDIRMRNKKGWTLLYAAVAGDSFALAARLIEAGAEVDARTNYDRLPLSMAAWHSEILRLLLDAGAEVNAVDRLGGPLIAASGVGNAAAVQLLLDKGADANTRGGYCGSALGEATLLEGSETYETIVRLLLNAGADVNLRGGEFGSPLGAAAYFGERIRVQLLLSEGADVNIPGGRYGSPLGAAVRSNGMECAHILLDAGAQIYLYGGHAADTLMDEALRNDGVIMRLNLEPGGRIELKGDSLNGILAHAVSSAFRRSCGIVRQLLKLWAAAPLGPGKMGRLLDETGSMREDRFMISVHDDLAKLRRERRKST